MFRKLVNNLEAEIAMRYLTIRLLSTAKTLY
jgi:hypothetical protein